MHLTAPQVDEADRDAVFDSADVDKSNSLDKNECKAALASWKADCQEIDWVALNAKAQAETAAAQKPKEQKSSACSLL